MTPEQKAHITALAEEAGGSAKDIALKMAELPHLSYEDVRAYIEPVAANVRQHRAFLEQQRKPSPAPASTPTPTPTSAAVQKPKGEAPKHKVPEWQRIDKRGATWEPRKTGPIAKDEVYGSNFPVPVYFTAEVQAAMSPAVLRTVMVVYRRADRDGVFDLPAAELGALLGCTARKARYPLETLLVAGLIRRKYQGGREQATVYQITSHREFNQGHAIRVLTEARAARRGFENIHKDKEGTDDAA